MDPAMNGLFSLALLLLFAAWLLRHFSRRQTGPGLSPAEIDHIDAEDNDEILISRSHDLTGRPDVILHDAQGRFPLERKSRALDNRGVYESEKLQLAAYALLIEATDGTTVRRGRLEYANSTVNLDIDDRLRQQLIHTLEAMRERRSATDVHRSHHHPARCRACAYRSQCGEALTQ
jgi:CRISPR-associated protein Cas4